MALFLNILLNGFNSGKFNEKNENDLAYIIYT